MVKASKFYSSSEPSKQRYTTLIEAQDHTVTDRKIL